MVQGAADFAAGPMVRPEPAVGIEPAIVGALIYQSKEPDAWPACPVLREPQQSNLLRLLDPGDGHEAGAARGGFAARKGQRLRR